MKASQTFGGLAAAILSVSTLTSAWPDFLPNMGAIVMGRADATTTASAAAKTSNSNAANTFNLNTAAASSTDSPSATDSSGSDATTTGTDKTTGTSKTTGKNKATTTTGSSGSNSTHTTFDAADAAGGVNMLTPATTAASTPLYRIGDYITLGWNYTSLQATPTAIDVLASVSTATRTFTLTQNMTFETKASYTWDTEAFQSANPGSQLLTAQYTLIIYDADSSVTAASEAGYLGTYSGFIFGLYEPQAYTPLSEGWQCVACSGGMSPTERRAVGFALTMSVITVLSFTWFVTGMRVAL